MANRLTILTREHPTLRQTAQRVTDIHDRRLQLFIDDLLLTLKESNGVGIAASQVDQPYQVMIVASRPNPRYPKAPSMEPTVMINPVIVARSLEQESGWEGCLSVPGLRGWVPRHCAITVDYCDRQGVLQRLEMEGFIARIFQHEYDHFQGILFCDRVEREMDLISEEEYQAMLEKEKQLSAG
ncbi:MAG: peptide deformylase [Synechococcales bacterium]|nr:peptide deformylase [Synechococcales bacterium]